MSLKPGCRHIQEARKDGGKANQAGGDLGAGKQLFRSNDYCHSYHPEGIHDPKNELDDHRGSTADTTFNALPAAQPEASFVLRGRDGASEWHTTASQVTHFPASQLHYPRNDKGSAREKRNGTTKPFRLHRQGHQGHSQNIHS
ncbi:MAG TPA: hypothetical protein VN824_15325, partial [Puia sp.]|nr:hypothetical protein [Puia sp.]